MVKSGQLKIGLTAVQCCWKLLFVSNLSYIYFLNEPPVVGFVCSPCSPDLCTAKLLNQCN